MTAQSRSIPRRAALFLFRENGTDRSASCRDLHKTNVFLRVASILLVIERQSRHVQKEPQMGDQKQNEKQNDQSKKTGTQDQDRNRDPQQGGKDQPREGR
jgi:hypothetical protein